MTLNYSKGQIMLLSRQAPLFAVLESEIIEQEHTYKYLGLVLTASLKWDDHLEAFLLSNYNPTR